MFRVYNTIMMKNIEKSQKTEHELHPIMWLYGPWLFFIGLVVFHFLAPVAYLEILDGEMGFIETFHHLIILLAFFVGVPILRRTIRAKNVFLSFWIGFATISSLYIALEEVSYGQHIFNWDTPEFWSNINDQNETNLHNTSSWLDQKLRLIFEIGVITGGLLIPLGQKYLKNPDKYMPQRFHLIYPTLAFAHVAFLGELAHVLESLIPYKIVIIGRASEVQETYYFYFVLMYMFLMRKRTKDL